MYAIEAAAVTIQRSVLINQRKGTLELPHPRTPNSVIPSLMRIFSPA